MNGPNPVVDLFKSDTFSGQYFGNEHELAFEFDRV